MGESLRKREKKVDLNINSAEFQGSADSFTRGNKNSNSELNLALSNIRGDFKSKKWLIEEFAQREHIDILVIEEN